MSILACHLLLSRGSSTVVAVSLSAAIACGSVERVYSERPAEIAALSAASSSGQDQEDDATSWSSPAVSGVSNGGGAGLGAMPGAEAPAVAPGSGVPGAGTASAYSGNTGHAGDSLEPAAGVCGDGVLDNTEQCDDGNDNSDQGADACRLTCVLPSCTDGVRDSSEECDDGNLVNNDDCSNTCKVPTCGDQIVQVGEACDDGNEIADDDCNGDCAVPGCGDGVVQTPREECDSAGVPADDCTAACRRPRCGDGILSAGESCDDGNSVATDACTTACRLPACGDGLLSEGEGCEDGNQRDGDGCSSGCSVEVCGDSILSPGEGCEDGNQLDGDGCSSTCQSEVCGDGKPTGVEQCDDGNHSDNDGCSSICRTETCGDGIVQMPREDCEDLNTVDTDLCRNGCKTAASLNSLSSSCSATDQITQTVCMVAVANWCHQYNHNPIAGMVTGKKAENEYTVGCILGFQRLEFSTNQLDQCQPGRQQSPACLEQISDSCRSSGFTRGFYLGTGSSGTFAVACDGGTTTTESISGCNGISDTSPVPVTCAQALATKCGNGKGGMIQARAQSNAVTYTCIDLTLTGIARQF